MKASTKSTEEADKIVRENYDDRQALRTAIAIALEASFQEGVESAEMMARLQKMGLCRWVNSPALPITGGGAGAEPV